MWKIIAIVMLLACNSWAIVSGTSPNIIYEINASATAGNLNGGGFNPSNANFIANFTTDTNTGNTASPVISSASYNFVAGDVGNWLYVKAGTNWYADCWFKIASVASNKATVDAAIGNAVCRSTTAGFPSPKWSANTVAGVASVGTPTNGTIGLDMSQATAARHSWVSGGSEFTNDLTCTNANPSVCTSSSYNFQAIDVGNSIHITAGTGINTGTTGEKWAEIVSVAANAATLDHNITTGAATLTAATAYLGGALSMNSTLDDDVMEAAGGTNGTGATKFFVKNGAVGIGEPVAISAGAAGGTEMPVVIEGYNSLRGDTPTLANCPVFNQGTNTFSTAANWDIYNARFRGTGTSVISLGTSSKLFNARVTQMSTTADRVAITLGSGSLLQGIEAISYRGRALSGAAVNSAILGSWIHDSNVLYYTANSNTAHLLIQNSILSGAVTNGFDASAFVVTSGVVTLNSNTFYGTEAKRGTAVNLATGNTNIRLTNNIFYGFTTAVSHADSQRVGFGDYNDYYNNTTNLTNWQTGSHSLTLDPQFTNVHEFTGTGASSSTNVLTYGTGGFNAVVVDGATWVNLSAGSGTGFATGIYPVSAHTDTTLTFADPAGNAMNITSSGAGSGIDFQFTYGFNFAIGANLKAAGFPGAMPGGSTGYLDIGAVQRQEPVGGGGGGSYSFVGK